MRDTGGEAAPGTLPGEGPIEPPGITGLSGVTEAQWAALLALGTVERLGAGVTLLHDTM